MKSVFKVKKRKSCSNADHDLVVVSTEHTRVLGSGYRISLQYK